MIKNASIILSFFILSGLTSCNLPARDSGSVSGKDIEQQYQAVSVLLTETAQAVSTLTVTPTMLPTGTLAVEFATDEPLPNTPTPVPAVAGTPKARPTPVILPAASKAQPVPCDLASPGRPMDLTVSDNTPFRPGEYFSKTWRLINAGSCSWTRDYAVVWFSGSDMGLNRAQPLNIDVKSGSAVDVTVDMAAPMEPGTYQSNWKMRNNQGALFGIGPNGDAPFWVRIVVVPLDTPTATPQLPTATETPAVFASGNLSLSPGDGLNLDSGQANQPENDDLLFQNPAEGQEELILAPQNGTRMVPFGMSQPGLADCQQAALSDAPVALDQYQPGLYLCFRTANGLPGWVSVTAVDPEKKLVSLQFATWAVP